MPQRRRISLVSLGIAALATGLVGGARPAGAAPNPASLTVAADGPAQPFTGGPITGGTDASGNVTPPTTCPSSSPNSCEVIPLTLTAPAGTPAKSITLSVTITFDTTGDPGGLGLTGIDAYLLDNTNKVLAQSTTGQSPAVLTAPSLDPGSYTVEVTGENLASNKTYSGTASAKVPHVSPPATTLTFAPSTVVSPTILGAEPQVSMERPQANTVAGALDPRRGFIDWPVSSRTMVGTLWRTTDGGDTYKQLVDPNCGPRQVPTCFTGGGGDTVNRVNNYDGTVNFGNQESLAQEAFASSTDHGDNWPPTRQFSVTSAATAVDRQWISTVDAPNVNGGPFTTFPLQALFSYHIPIAGEYVAGVGTDGILRPAAVPVITQVSQSGPSRIWLDPKSPGKGYFYQSYRDGSGFELGVVPLDRYQDPNAYKVQRVSKDVPQVFPWIALDSAGNIYATWVAPDGQLYYSYSLIREAKNDPDRSGVPGTTWSPRQKVNAPALGSTVFPEIVAGDPGRIAIAYDATPDYKGLSDNASQGPTPPAARWWTFVSMSTNALDALPSFQTGYVAHRIVHTGSVCTSGTTCAATMGDRSLLDMIDVTTDSDGRIGVVYTNNNNTFAENESSLGSKGDPYVMFAKLANGPSLLNGHGPYAFTYPTAYRGGTAGDARWPNRAGGTLLPSLDVVGSGVFVDQSSLVARIDLTDASAAGMTRDLAAYTAATPTDPPAQRVQYVLRFETDKDVWYLAFDQDASGNRRAYGGQVTTANAVSNLNTPVGITYDPQSSFPVTYQVQGNTLLLRGRLSDFKVGLGSTLLSVAGYALAGQSDQNLLAGSSDSQLITVDRAVDASPPFDAVLAGPGSQPPVCANGVCQAVATLPVPSIPNTGGLRLPAAAPTGGVVAVLTLAVGVGRRRRRRAT